ncbi:hypothetical protein PSTT_09686 [Puccinia striiformis]|uniref:Uncharacterized protein n=1 Tax=Puccinia striiformis TaxID=27350 RepID=A0A2S4V7D9_9BASI|nr:hypothetical protein PSTT_09686 [Puccinia striiformis]
MLKHTGSIRKGSNVIVWTDNNTTLSVLERRKSRDPQVNNEWKIIQDFLIAEELDLSGKRVRTEDNVADDLSRGIQEKVDYDTAKLSTFLKNGTSVRIITTTDAHILRGWSYNTLLGYNCGIKKYLSWKNVTGVQDFTLPMTNSDLEGFCLWAGKKHRMINSHNVNAKTIRKFFKWIQGVARLPWENLPSVARR